MKKVTLPKQGSVSVKLRKQKRNRKVLVLPEISQVEVNFRIHSLIDTFIGKSKKPRHTLQMFCLLKSQTIACKPNPKTTSNNFNR